MPSLRPGTVATPTHVCMCIMHAWYAIGMYMYCMHVRRNTVEPLCKGHVLDWHFLSLNRDVSSSRRLKRTESISKSLFSCEKPVLVQMVYNVIGG